MPVRLLRRGKKERWYVDFYFNGRRIRKPAEGETELEALRYEHQLKAKMVARDERLQEPVFWVSPTFRDFVEEWRRTYLEVHNRPSTVATHSRSMNVYILPALGGLALESITTERVDRLKESLVERGLAPKTVNNILSILRNCLNIAVEWRRLRELPKFRWLSVPEVSYRVLTTDEIARLLQSTPDESWRTLILFFAKTGCRFGEVTALRWEDVQLEGTPYVQIRQASYKGIIGPTKNKKHRSIPLAADIAEALRRRMRTKGYVFTGPDGQLLRSSSSVHQLYKICDAARVKRTAWHVFRHTFASQLVQKNVNVRVVQELLGHVLLETTLRYTHVEREATQSAVSQLDNHVGTQKATAFLSGGVDK